METTIHSMVHLALLGIFIASAGNSAKPWEQAMVSWQPAMTRQMPHEPFPASRFVRACSNETVVMSDFENEGTRKSPADQ